MLWGLSLSRGPLGKSCSRHSGILSASCKAKILDIGCGKGFLLYDFLKVIPDAEIYGIDISEYAIANSKPEIRDRLQVGNAIDLPWEDSSFDLVISINTLHNLHTYDLDPALREMERVGKQHKYVCVESYRNEDEKQLLAVTCEAFNTPEVVVVVQANRVHRRSFLHHFE